MTTNTKKILIHEELVLASVGEFFKALGFELCSEYSEDIHYEFSYGDFPVEDLQIPRVIFEDECFFESDKKYLLKADARFLNDPMTTEILSDFFSKSYSFFKLEELKNSTIVNLKLQDYLNLGFFVDTIVINGHKKNYNVSIIRKFLNEMCEVLFHKVDSAFNSIPLEINYCFDEDSFKIHFEFTCHQLDIFQEELIKRDILHISNFSELIILERRSKAIFKCVFYKDNKLSQMHAFSCKELGISESYSETTNEFSAISGLEDPGYTPFNELEDEEFLTKISLSEDELSEIVHYFSSQNPEADGIELVKGSGEENLDKQIIFQNLENTLKNEISSKGQMSLNDVKAAIYREFAQAKRDDAQKMFEGFVEQLKKNKAAQKSTAEKNTEDYRLKVSLQKSISLIKNKDALIKKLRRDAQLKSDLHFQEMNQLEAKLKSLRIDLSDAKNKATPEALVQDAPPVEVDSQENVAIGEVGEGPSQNEIEELKKEAKLNEENLKKAQLEIKKLEQKLKFSNSQFDSLMKKKNVVPKGVAKANFELLRDNETLKTSLRKLEQEVAEKKTEGHRFKQETSILTNKISELEKKLAYAEKKSA